MRGIDDIHTLAVLHLFAGDADLVENLMGRSADGGFVHQVSAVPEPATEREALFDDQGPESHVGQVARANQAGRTRTDDDHVAFNELIELFVVFARDLARDVALP